MPQIMDAKQISISQYYPLPPITQSNLISELRKGGGKHQFREIMGTIFPILPPSSGG